MTKTEYFIGRPKIFINIIYKGRGEFNAIKANQKNEISQKTVQYSHNADVVTIFANAPEKTIIESFTQVFCQVVESNVNDIGRIVMGQALEKEIVQTVSKAYCEIYLIPRSSIQQILSDNSKLGQQAKLYSTPEALDFKKHWNRSWRKANAEAAKRVEQMIHTNDQGLIIVAYNTLKWKNRNDNLSSIKR
ncbi:hypothetical protein RFI_34842, partial [Reticulomyxa filosa]